MVCGFRTHDVRIVKKTQCVLFLLVLIRRPAAWRRADIIKKIESQHVVYTLVRQHVSSKNIKKSKRRKSSSWHTHTYTSVFLNRRQYIHNTKHNCIELYIISLWREKKMRTVERKPSFFVDSRSKVRLNFIVDQHLWLHHIMHLNHWTFSIHIEISNKMNIYRTWMKFVVPCSPMHSRSSVDNDEDDVKSMHLIEIWCLCTFRIKRKTKKKKKETRFDYV